MGIFNNFIKSLILRSNDNAKSLPFNTETIGVKTMNQSESPMLTIIVFKLGSLEVYYKQTLEEERNNVPPAEYFWRDDGSPQGHGPWTYIHQAVEHYTYIQKQFNSLPLPQQPNSAQIIHIDFQNRRKLNN